MSFFAVEKRKISKVWNHPNADRLDLASVEGLTFQFVVQKGTQTVDNLVAFFPVDSLLPDDLIEHFGIGNMLAGKDKNRIKTVRLRSEVSQGFVSNANSICEFLKKKGQIFTPETLPNDLTSLLNVEKYEPPATLEKNARLLPLDMKAYDIEGADRYPSVINYLMDKDVIVEEKLEGQNFHFTLKADGSTKIGQRNFYIESNDPENPHTFEVVAKRDFMDLCQKIQSEKFPNSDIRLRAEMLGEGIQKNIYGIKGHKAIVFEIDINNQPMNTIDVLELVKEYNIEFVPILFVGKLREFLNGKTIQEASNGISKLVNIKREGIVIHTFREEFSQELGMRLIIKQRSPDYLSSSDF